MEGADVFYIIRSSTSLGDSNSLNGEPTVRLTPEFSQTRFVIENGDTTIWQLNYGTDAPSAMVVRPLDYSTTNAKVWKKVMSSGGSSIPIYQAQKTITNAQIITLPTTDVELVAAPGSGITYKFVFARMILDNRAGAYSGFDANCEIDVCVANSNQSQYVEADNTAFGDDSAIHVLDFYDGARDVTSFGAVWVADVGDLDNKPFKLRTFNQTLDFAGGNAANSLIVSILYMKCSTTTCLFV